MTDNQAIKFIADIFDSIKKSKTISQLEAIPVRSKILGKNRMNIDRYPKIEFNIKPEEINVLIENKIIDKDLNFSKDISSKFTDTCTKLLYAIVWKNGDLQKVKHIIKGIVDTENKKANNKVALVFYQFGKYLTQNHNEPIIDQHVLRAFAIYKLSDSKKITAIRKMKSLNKNHTLLISEYKEWLTSDEISKELKKEEDYVYHIDKILFASGKSIKFLKPTYKRSIGSKDVFSNPET